MKLPHGSTLVVTALALSCAAAAGGQSVSGRDVAAACAACHGTEGRARGAIPALAGRPKDDMAAKLREFRDGKRPSTVMQQLAKGYTDAQIEGAAAYFAAQKP